MQADHIGWFPLVLLVDVVRGVVEQVRSNRPEFAFYYTSRGKAGLLWKEITNANSLPVESVFRARLRLETEFRGVRSQTEFGNEGGWNGLQNFLPRSQTPFGNALPETPFPEPPQPH